MNKVKINSNAFGFPMPIAILGSMYQGKPTFMALGWFSRVNHQPPMIGIGVGQSHVTHDTIKDLGCFSLSIPSRELLVDTDYVGIVSAIKVDKSGLFPVFYGELENAPMVETCPVSMECRVKEVIALPSNTFFIGEIVNAYSEERFLDKHQQVDLSLSDPIMLSMLDNRFWSIGEPVGKAWSDGAQRIS